MSGPLARNTKRSSDWPVIESSLDSKIEHAGGARPVFWRQVVENRATIVLEKCHRLLALCKIVQWNAGLEYSSQFRFASRFHINAHAIGNSIPRESLRNK
jgi:hypothetical protein